MIKRWMTYVVKKQYHAKIPNVETYNYKELTDLNFLNFLRKLKMIKYTEKRTPIQFDYRAFEVHSIERISKNPKIIVDFILEYLDANKGTEKCLNEMCQVVADNFDIVARQYQFSALLQKLSSWTMALNQDLLAKTNDFLGISL